MIRRWLAVAGCGSSGDTGSTSGGGAYGGLLASSTTEATTAEPRSDRRGGDVGRPKPEDRHECMVDSKGLTLY